MSTKLEPIKFWCQKVLPLVYDDSLSYYEVLAKTVDYLNNVIEDDKNVIKLVNNLEVWVNENKEYIDNYFENLNVQNEINAKLDEMVEDGTFGEIIDPILEQFEQDAMGNLSQQVSDWLEGNITPTTPVIDATLTISGAGADAKVTGDEITVLKNAFKYVDEGHIKTDLAVTAGRYINRSGVLVVNNNQHLAISDYIKIPAQTYKIIGTKHPANITDTLYAMNFYGGNKTWLGGFDYYDTGTIESADFPEGSEYVILQDYDPDTPILHNKCSVTFYAFTLTASVDNLIEQTDVSTAGIVNDIFTDKTANKNTNINYTTGDAQNNANFLATNYIEVKPNTEYHVMRDNQLVSGTANMAFYTEAKQYISGIPSTWDNWTTPANAKYVRISVYMSPWTQDTFTFDNVQIIEGTEAKVVNDIALFTKAYYSPLNGKKWIGIGDSLTEINARADLRYWNYIANPNNMTFVNMGVGGSGYIQRQNENKAFYQRVADMDTDADIITIFGGVNDCLFATASIGTPTDTGTTTWCGCVNTLIDNIRNKYLYANIGIISPLPCDWIDPSNESQYDTQLPSDTTCRMSEFVDKLKTICALRGVPFLDLFHQSNMRPDDADFRAEYYSCGTTRNGDGLHPNSKGHRVFYRKIQQFIESMIQ